MDNKQNEEKAERPSLYSLYLIRWYCDTQNSKPADAESIKTHLQRQQSSTAKKKRKRQSARQFRESEFSDQNHQMWSDDLDRRKLQAWAVEPLSQAASNSGENQWKNERGGEQRERSRGKGKNFRHLRFFICFDLWLFCG